MEASPATLHVEASPATRHHVEPCLAQHETRARARHISRSLQPHSCKTTKRVDLHLQEKKSGFIRQSTLSGIDQPGQEFRRVKRENFFFHHLRYGGRFLFGIRLRGQGSLALGGCQLKRAAH